jgi:hypothetical protein
MIAPVRLANFHAPLSERPGSETNRARGAGSFVCTEQYCSGYMVAKRGKGETVTGIVSASVSRRCPDWDNRAFAPSCNKRSTTKIRLPAAIAVRGLFAALESSAYKI